MTTLIGLSGKKQSGKNTVADIIARLYSVNKKVTQIGFADSLKEEVAKACNTTVDEINLHKDTYREILQFWGTNYRRKFFGPDYWIKQLAIKLQNCFADIILVTDVRFLNEAKFIRELNGYVIRVNRAQNTIDYLRDKHPSECDLDSGFKFDFILENNGTVDDLYVRTKEMMKMLNNFK